MGFREKDCKAKTTPGVFPKVNKVSTLTLFSIPFRVDVLGSTWSEIR